MARPDLSESVENINNRRSQVLLLLAENKTLSQISQQLKVPISTINDDNKFIKRQGLKFLGNISKQELSYHFFVSLTNIMMINRDCLEIAKDKVNVSIKDRLRAYQLVEQTIKDKDELLLEAIKSFSYEELKARIDLLNDQLDSNINNQSETKLSDILNKDLLLNKNIELDKDKVIEVKQLEDKTNNNNKHITNNSNNNNNKNNKSK